MIIKKYNSFIFTHIPKCGGSSFRKYILDAGLSNKIANHQIYTPGLNGVENDKNIRQLSKVERDQFREKKVKILADHSMFGVNQRYKLGLPNPFLYVLFRHPVKRIISHYNFFHFNQGHGNCKGIQINDLKISKLENILVELSNLQVRYLTGIDKNTGSNVNNHTLLTAISALERYYACFGILEKLEQSISILRQYAPDWLRFKQNFPVVNKNKKNNYFKPNKLVVEKIEQFNQIDIKFYEYAVKLFDLRYSAFYKSHF